MVARGRHRRHSTEGTHWQWGRVGDPTHAHPPSLLYVPGGRRGRSLSALALPLCTVCEAAQEITQQQATPAPRLRGCRKPGKQLRGALLPQGRWAASGRTGSARHVGGGRSSSGHPALGHLKTKTPLGERGCSLSDPLDNLSDPTDHPLATLLWQAVREHSLHVGGAARGPFTGFPHPLHTMPCHSLVLNTPKAIIKEHSRKPGAENKTEMKLDGEKASRSKEKALDQNSDLSTSSASLGLRVACFPGSVSSCANGLPRLSLLRIF